VIRQFARIRQAGPPREVSELTERELDVFRLIARGYSNAEIPPADPALSHPDSRDLLLVFSCRRSVRAAASIYLACLSGPR
jgi:hypothetical protein